MEVPRNDARCYSYVPTLIFNFGPELIRAKRHDVRFN